MGDGWRWLPVERASSGDTGAAGHARLARLLGMPDGCQAAGDGMDGLELLPAGGAHAPHLRLGALQLLRQGRRPFCRLPLLRFDSR